MDNEQFFIELRLRLLGLDSDDFCGCHEGDLDDRFLGGLEKVVEVVRQMLEEGWKWNRG